MGTAGGLVQLALNDVVVFVTAENGKQCQQQPKVFLEWSDQGTNRTTCQAELPQPELMNDTKEDQSHCFMFNRYRANIGNIDCCVSACAHDLACPQPQSHTCPLLLLSSTYCTCF